MVILDEDAAQPLASADTKTGDFGVIADRLWQWS
jgi:hypothetical protein